MLSDTREQCLSNLKPRKDEEEVQEEEKNSGWNYTLLIMITS